MTKQRDSSAMGRVHDVAERHGFSQDASRAMALAMAAGEGSMAQFDHPELGGMGQWSRGGMVMIGDMFDEGLKARVRSLADDLADAAADGDVLDRLVHDGTGDRAFRATDRWWPVDLGEPTSSGSQDGGRYAVFSNLRRLVVERGGQTTIYDTGDHRIGGASQRQGSPSGLAFTSQNGNVRLEDLPVV